MTEENRSFWDRLLGTHHRTEREEKVLEYICHRVGDGAHLQDVIQEEYVRRNANPEEIDEMLDDPRLVQTAHDKMREEFASEDLEPKPPPRSAG